MWSQIADLFVRVDDLMPPPTDWRSAWLASNALSDGSECGVQESARKAISEARENLREAIELPDELPMRSIAVDLEPLWNDAFTWLQKYADHEPDWADGYLLALTRAVGGALIWTYDKEYATISRNLDGKRPKLLVDPRRRAGSSCRDAA